MTTPIKGTIVFDLDDTLYAEIDFLKSAYKYIAYKLDPNSKNLYDSMIDDYFNNNNVFNNLSVKYNVEITTLLVWYRFHSPNIKLYPNVQRFINKFRSHFDFSMVTDGRSKTQLNKIEALGIYEYLSNIVISEDIGSEKPNRNNFKKAISNLNQENCYYIGDNVNKDFITPNKMGWTTICLIDSGQNIHKQDFDKPEVYLPRYCFQNWAEIDEFFDNMMY